MIAEDYADQASDAEQLYKIVQSRLLTASSENMLPVLYVLDSILKNAKGCYIAMVERDAVTWMPKVYARLHKNRQAQQNLQKVWRTWNEPFHLFDAATWRAMGRCFAAEQQPTNEVGGSSSSTTSGTAAATAASHQQSTLTTTAGGTTIARTADGRLILSKKLREEMQNMLDDMQEGLTNELDKVSLERLADVNPDLLANIKAEAEKAVFGTNQNQNQSSSSGNQQHSNVSKRQQQQSNKTNELPTFLTDPRSERVRHRAEEWSQTAPTASSEPLLAVVSDSVVPSLRQLVAAATADDAAFLYTQSEALQMTRYLAVAVATQQLLTATVEQVQRQPQKQSSAQQQKSQQQQQQHSSSASFAVDPAQFTNDGIKQRNAAAIGWLYEIGLPFQSSADGRRFRTQLALSQHLDALFRRRRQQSSKQQQGVLVLAGGGATAERGWYLYDTVWTREETADQQVDQYGAAGMDVDDDDNNNDNETNNGNNNSAESSTFLADETRDRCVVCGTPFRMFFDSEQDGGVYKYRNCRQIVVWNDDAAATESDPQLVHASCWSGLGEPDTLTADQTMQDLLVHHGSS